METFLWTVQIFFGLFFLAHGFTLLAQPERRRETLARLPFSKGLLRFVGACEILGALGLVLPWWLGIWPFLTPLAALGLAVVLLGAAFTHARAGETPPAVGTLALALLLTVVAGTRL